MMKSVIEIGMNTYKNKKYVDNSFLTAGLTIPIYNLDVFLNELGVFVKPGEKTTIRVIVDDQLFPGITFSHIDSQKNQRNSELYQIRYSTNSPIAEYLKKSFPVSVGRIQNNDDLKDIPEDFREYAIISVPKEKTVKFELFPLDKKVEHDSKIKQKFLEYLGSEESLTGYQRSYKLVFYRAFFDIFDSMDSDNNKLVSETELAQRFRDYFRHRVNAGKIPDTKADPVIKNIETSSVEQVRQFINRMPFDKIQNKDFFTEEVENDIAYYQLLPELKDALTDDDIKEIRRIVDKKLEIYFQKIDINQPPTKLRPGINLMSPIEKLEQIKSYISSKGYVYTDGIIDNFYLSLKSKPFVILAGISGTGKTRLIKLFAEAVGATVNNGRFSLVSVRPDWSDSSDLFGHLDINGKFVAGSILEFIKNAENEPDKPYFLCLDEMNLARVEYYFSDFLSILETRERIGDTIETDPLINNSAYGTDDDALDRYGEVRIPENLYIIGTVNMDETTFPFSKKVLDRANTIEFSDIDLSVMPQPRDDSIQPLDLDNSFLKTNFLKLQDCLDNPDEIQIVNKTIQTINDILQGSNSQVGYRVRDEIAFYILNNQQYKVMEEDKAFDYEIMQKILPRLQGSSQALKRVLTNLFQFCMGPETGGLQVDSDDTADEMRKLIENGSPKYEMSARKINYMVERLEEDGFTSFWL